MATENRGWRKGDVFRAVFSGLGFAGFAVLLWPLAALALFYWVVAGLTRRTLGPRSGLNLAKPRGGFKRSLPDES